MFKCAAIAPCFFHILYPLPRGQKTAGRNTGTGRNKKDAAERTTRHEWLKEILGDSYTEDIDGRVSAEIGKGFVARADFNTKNDEVKTLQGQLKTAQDG